MEGGGYVFAANFQLTVQGGFLHSFVSLICPVKYSLAFYRLLHGFSFFNSANVTEQFLHVRRCAGCWEYGVVNKAGTMAAPVGLRF